VIGGLQKKMKSFQKSKLGSMLLCEDVIAKVCTQPNPAMCQKGAELKAWATSFPSA